MNMEQNTQDAVRQTHIYNPVGTKQYIYGTNTNRIQGILSIHIHTYVHMYIHTHTWRRKHKGKTGSHKRGRGMHTDMYVYLETSRSVREEGGRCVYVDQ